MKKNIKIIANCILFLVPLICVLFLEIQDENKEKNIIVSYVYSKQSITNPISELKKIYNNDEIIAKIEIENTKINEPVVQTKDNDYYLKYDLFKNKDKKGSVYFDYRIDFENSKKSLIYGHMSSKNDTPFSELKNYLNEEYYEEHKYIKITTDKKEYIYKIFVVTVYSSDYDYLKVSFKTDEDYIRNLKSFISKSLYNDGNELQSTDKTLFLQTCYPKKHGSYIIIGAKLITEN